MDFFNDGINSNANHFPASVNGGRLTAIIGCDHWAFWLQTVPWFGLHGQQDLVTQLQCACVCVRVHERDKPLQLD